jgi:predicted kinase
MAIPRKKAKKSRVTSASERLHPRTRLNRGIYTAGWTDRTYAECLSRAERLLFEVHRIIVDANFREDRRRRAFLEASARLAVPAVFLLCQAHPEVVRQRQVGRRDDASDVDWSI